MRDRVKEELSHSFRIRLRYEVHSIRRNIDGLFRELVKKPHIGLEYLHLSSRFCFIAKHRAVFALEAL